MGEFSPSPTNPEFFANLTAQLQGCSACAQLQAQVTEAFAGLQQYSDAINAQLALLAPMLALLDVPSDPAAVVTWVGNFITNFLTPYLVPYTTYATQLTQLASEVESLTSAIEATAKNLPNCKITIPVIT